MADLGLTMEAQTTLERAFDDAKQWKRKRMRLRGSGPEGWEEAKTQFEKNQSDIRLESVSYTHLTLPTIYSV